MLDPLSEVKSGDATLTPCEAYTALFKVRRTDAARWSFAAQLVGAAAALALVATIVLAVIGENGAAVASIVGTVVTGAATGWLWQRRTEVQNEANAFLDKVTNFCSEDAVRALQD